MKTFTKAIAAASLILVVAAPASAMLSSDIKSDVRSAAGSNSNVNVLIDGTTVTLTGYVEDAYALQAIAQAASTDGVDTVINNVLRTN